MNWLDSTLDKELQELKDMQCRRCSLAKNTTPVGYLIPNAQS